MAEKGKKEAAKAGKGGEITRVTPTRALSPFDEMERMFDEFFPRSWMRPFRFAWPEMPAAFEGRVPRVDVIDRENDILVRAELPGVDKKDVDISMSDNMVTIKGSTRHEEKEEKGDYYRCEISRGSFSRSVALPADVEGDKAKASFKDGVLELTVPKSQKAKRRTIKLD
jgi:HSP20 family protein